MTTFKENYSLGFVLSGGGAKGFAHIGAMKALAENGFKPDIISGVSAGSILGVLFCDGYDPDEVTEILMKESFTSLFEFTIPRKGFLTLNGLQDFLKKHLRAKSFEQLKTPLVVTATDFDRCESVYFRSGNLIDAISASCSIPAIFNPYEIDGVYYVDGGVLSNLPVIPIRKECDRIIGISVTAILTTDYKKTIVGISDRAFRLMLKANTFLEKDLCDLFIELEESKRYNIFDLKSVEEISKLGYDATLSALALNTNNDQLSAI